jgi:hypothetical protein
MILSSAMPHQIEIPAQNATQPQARDDFRIEEILRRARQIHREHGGFFGYDFDDWAQAWAELPLTAARANAQSASTKQADSALTLEREVLEPCFGCGN